MKDKYEISLWEDYQNDEKWRGSCTYKERGKGAGYAG